MEISICRDDDYTNFALVNIIDLINTEEKIILALSGGNTPVPIYKLLARELVIHSIEFDIIQVDERFVSRDSERSNQKMIKNVMRFEDERYCFMPTSDDFDNVKEAAEVYNGKLKDLMKENPIDLVILGMGVDGHTASLFPGNNEFYASITREDLTLGTYVESQKEERISLSPNLIRDAKRRVLLIKGEEKGRLLALAQKGGNKEVLPISLFLDEKTLVIMDGPCHAAYMEEMN